ncbi:AlpA family transcriptional regulator [Vibrio cholerae]|uniref:AlpA family transcriptional regulator n=1 Tax=Vibrio cholerae TaxID=666 RepID=UPI00084AC8BE|nr:AlpA family transcriptional regulator [Vibrio cholerae]MBY7999412.1 AlpA family transcriptional regulator [Vibrio fluvialis]MCU8331832.1 AlpA family transcriptional regulator [Vibrio vulnificus]NOF78531.1 AlpA family transcriptional regulator [Vibrio cholerae]OEC29218.1 transcriptional regulator [Vibrio cholerae]
MQLLNLKEVIYLTGLKRSSIYKFMDEGHFPKSVSIGGRSVMWKDCDIDEWICEKIRRRN